MTIDAHPTFQAWAPPSIAGCCAGLAHTLPLTARAPACRAYPQKMQPTPTCRLDVLAPLDGRLDCLGRVPCLYVVRHRGVGLVLRGQPVAPLRLEGDNLKMATRVVWADGFWVKRLCCTARVIPQTASQQGPPPQSVSSLRPAWAGAAVRASSTALRYARPRRYAASASAARPSAAARSPARSCSPALASAADTADRRAGS